MRAVAPGLAVVIVALVGARLHRTVVGATRGRTTRLGPPLQWMGTAGAVALGRSRARRHRRAGIAPGAVVDWCESIARRLRGGTTLREAVRVDVPADDALAHSTDDVRRRLDRGEPLAIALRDGVATVDARRGGGSLELAAATLATAAELGGPAAAALDRVGATLRLRAADRAERTAQSAQARLSAHVLTAVPLAVVALLASSDADVRRTLASAAGAAVLTGGLALNAIGWWWMRRIVRVVG